MKGLFLLAILAATTFSTTRADSVVVFNEIMYHPATNEPALEWVEFHNLLAVDVDVSDWTISGGIDFHFAPHTVIKGGEFLVVASAPATLKTQRGLNNVDGPFQGKLGNSGDTLRLLNNSGRVMDEVKYGTEGDWPVAPDGGGVSLAKLDPDAASAPAENWAASREMGGTPGAANFPPNFSPAATLVFYEVSAATNNPFFIEIVNAGNAPVSLANVILRHEGAANHSFNFGPTNLLPGVTHLILLTPQQLGFQPVSGDKLYLMQSKFGPVSDAVKVGNRTQARYPAVDSPWRFPDRPTPGASNWVTIRNEIVINEIMYHHALAPPASSNAPPQESREAWIELYNRSGSTVDLSGWQLAGGVRYQFEPGQSVPSNGYLVVANDAPEMRLLFPNINVVGDFKGRLSAKSDRIVLTDPRGNPADEVRYFDGGRWPSYADGGGASLELRDPNSDNSKAEAWSASDESRKTSWQTVSYQMVAAPSPTPGPDNRWHEFVFGLLGDGECLIDNISVVELSGNNPVQLIDNGDFERGTADWRFLGDHSHSSVIADPQSPSNHVLHLIATGPQEHMHNHIETTLADGREVINGRIYRISYRAKFWAGNNLLNTRLYFNRVARTTALSVPALNGTPGTVNSRRETNIGPTFSQFAHKSVVPKANEPVTVSIVAQDPQGVASCELFWSVNSAAFQHAAMSSSGFGRYTGTIPGQTSGSIVQFYVRAVDALGAAAMFPARGPASGALFKVNDGAANLAMGHNIRLILTPANTVLLHALTNVMSNDLLPCTVVYDENRCYYDVGIHLKSSERGRDVPGRVGFHIVFQPDDLFRGVHPVMLIDRSPGGGRPLNEEILIRHMLNRAGGIPAVQSDLCLVLAPQKAQNGMAILAPRFEDEFIETAFEKGGEGTLFELELIYYPMMADGNGYKIPEPDGVQGLEIADLGNDKENYRYNFILKNHRAADDYTGWITFAKSWSLNGPALENGARGTTDIDEWMRAEALVSLWGVGDTYGYGLSHNLMAYLRPSDRRVLYIPWDMDNVSGGGSSRLVAGSNIGKIMTTIPENLRCFYANVLDHLETVFNTSYMTDWIESYGSHAGQDYSFRVGYIEQRGEFARSQIEAAGGNAPFAIAQTGGVIRAGNGAVTLSGTAPVNVKTIRVNGAERPVAWTSISGWRMVIPAGATNTLNLVGYDLHQKPVGVVFVSP